MCNCKNYADTFLKYFLVSIPNQLNILKTFHKSLKTTIIMKLAKLHTSQLKFSLLRDSCNRHYWSQYLLFFLVLITGKFCTWLTLYLIRVGNYKSSLFWEIMIKIGYYLDCYISFSSTRWTHYLKKQTNCCQNINTQFIRILHNTEIQPVGKKNRTISRHWHHILTTTTKSVSCTISCWLLWISRTRTYIMKDWAQC